MAATMKLSIAFVLLLLADQAALVVLADVGDPGAAACAAVSCAQGGYITCENYWNHKKKLGGCACVCAPSNGNRCVLHLNDGTSQWCPKTNY